MASGERQGAGHGVHARALEPDGSFVLALYEVGVRERAFSVRDLYRLPGEFEDAVCDLLAVAVLDRYREVVALLGREGGFLMSAKGLNISTDAGIMVALLVRIRELIWTAIGLLLIRIKDKG